MPIGYDKFDLHQNLLLNLKFVEGVGLITHDWAKPNHTNPLLVGAPAWYQLANDKNYLDFDLSNPDWIEIAQANSVDLDFTSGDFSMAIYFNADILNVSHMLLNRGTWNADGWRCYIGTNGDIYFQTMQTGATQSTDTSVGEIVVGTWYFVLFTRSGNSIRIYINGIDKTDSAGSHTNPLTANNNLEIGNDFDGKVGEVWVWNRELTPADVKQLYELTKEAYE